MADPLLRVDNLCVAFRNERGQHRVVDQVCFNLERGEVLGIVGESGSGKSVTALAILGLLPQPAGLVESGAVYFQDQELTGAALAALLKVRGKRISMIFQEPMSALNPVHRIERQLLEVFQLHRPELSRAEMRQEAIAILEEVGISDAESKLDSYPHQLSGGQCQRIMIAMALVGKPDILIADEPTTALDVTTQQQILALLARLKAEYNLSVIFITHDLGLIAQVADRVVVMQNGQVVENGDVFQLYRTPEHPYTQQLLGSVLHLDSPAKATGPTIDRDGEPLITLEQFSKHYPVRKGIFSRISGYVEAVNAIDLSIYPGETLGLVGESGCGKSTLAKALLNLDPPSSGRLRYRGRDLTGLSRREWRALRRELQIVFQDPNESLNPRHTVGAILEEPLLIHGIGNAAERQQRIAELLEKVELPRNSASRFPHEFSGGQRQRIGIARAIALDPQFLICDEAVSALDATTQSQVLALLLRLQRELGLTMLFISHDLAVVKHVSDRIAVMQAGEIVELADAQTLYRDPQHPYTRTLLAAIPHPDPTRRRDAASV